MIFCMFLFFHVLFMFQKEELQDVILFVIRAARGRGVRSRRERGRGWGRGKRWRRENIYHNY